MKDKILRAIPIIGVTIFALGIVSLFLLVWGNNPLLNLKIIITSFMGVIILRILEKVIE
jgi:hypothetical protein